MNDVAKGISELCDEVSRLRDTLRQVRDDLTLIVAEHKLGRDANVGRAAKRLRAALQ